MVEELGGKTEEEAGEANDNASFHRSNIILKWLVTHKTPYSSFLKPTEEFSQHVY